jgi:hypothetical protein
MSNENTAAEATTTEELLVDGLSRELFHDGQLLVLNFQKWVSRTVVDAFAKAYLEYGESMGSKQRYVVYDFHRSRMAITPYLGMKVEEINKISTNETGRLGMAIYNPAIRHLIRMFVRRQQHTQPDLEFGFFATRQEAMSWVEEAYQKANIH